MPRALDQFERVEITERAQWRAWLTRHHTQADSVWVVTFKKGASRPRVPYDDLVEEALAFGWVDSLPRRLDDERTMLLMSPRKPGSNWSAVNKARVEKMTATGLMHPAGQAKVDQAKRDGTWTALDAVERLEVPDDLAEALSARPGARETWDGFPRSVRRGVLEWIGAAKTPETRGKRVTETADRAERGERANQWR
ncbi:MAG: YdeI/OmpD-associated family protein [Caulobacteraceae bacterium]|nr:YdeI/OmpD-associated family protein [Caulobacteraceae bacterium]